MNTWNKQSEEDGGKTAEEKKAEEEPKKKRKKLSYKDQIEWDGIEDKIAPKKSISVWKRKSLKREVISERYKN